MSRLMILPFALAGLVLAVLVAGAARQHLAATGEMAALDTDKPGSVEKTPTPEPAHVEPDKVVRAIEKQSFVPPFGKNAAGLERLPARPPLTPPPKKIEKQPGFLLRLPMVNEPGILSFGNRQIILSGLKPLATARTCGDGASVWPCGQWALNALRRRVRGRSVFCTIADPGWKGTVTADCAVAGRDISGWLVENGWAEAAPGSTFVAAMHEAAEKRVGIFGSDPRAEGGEQQ